MIYQLRFAHLHVLLDQTSIRKWGMALHACAAGVQDCSRIATAAV